MDKNTAYKILELNPGASKDEITSAFRKAAKKWHPDRNSDPKAEEKFKEINSAYQFLLNPPKETFKFNNSQDFINDFIDFANINFSNSSHRNSYKKKEVPSFKEKLTFIESVKGCKRKITFDKFIKCKDCNGAGATIGVDICDVCNGSGMEKTIHRGGIHFMTNCSKCSSTGRKLTECNACSGDGSKAENKTLEILIPPGVSDRAILRVQNAGNFIGLNVLGQEIYGDILVHLSVDKDDEMMLNDNNVISNLSISLLEALKGATRKVRTINGDYDLEIKAGIKNKEEIKIKGFGVPNKGDHIFTIEVEYPDDISNLITLLEKENNGI